MITGIITVWAIAGAIMIAVFYSERVLPANRWHKTIVALMISGPIVWIAVPVVYGAIAFAKWLEK